MKNILSGSFLSPKMSCHGLYRSVTTEMFKIYTQITCFLHSIPTLAQFANRYEIVSGHLNTQCFFEKQRVRISLIFFLTILEGEKYIK